LESERFELQGHVAIDFRNGRFCPGDEGGRPAARSSN